MEEPTNELTITRVHFNCFHFQNLIHCNQFHNNFFKCFVLDVIIFIEFKFNIFQEYFNLMNSVIKNSKFQVDNEYH